MAPRKGVSRGKYNQHIVYTGGRVSCYYCRTIVERKKILVQHMKSIHLKYKAKCPLCPKTYSEVGSANRHLKSKHGVGNSAKFKIKLEPPSTMKNEPISIPMNPATASECHDIFPEMTKNLTITENATFGRHLIASNNIEEGETLMRCQPFASIHMVSSEDKCFSCGNNDINVNLDCEHCESIHFCSKKCIGNTSHKKYCDKIFKKTDNRSIE